MSKTGILFSLALYWVEKLNKGFDPLKDFRAFINPKDVPLVSTKFETPFSPFISSSPGIPSPTLISQSNSAGPSPSIESLSVNISPGSVISSSKNVYYDDGISEIIIFLRTITNFNSQFEYVSVLLKLLRIAFDFEKCRVRALDINSQETLMYLLRLSLQKDNKQYLAVAENILLILGPLMREATVRKRILEKKHRNFDSSPHFTPLLDTSMFFFL
jgi:hypothetical protein